MKRPRRNGDKARATSDPGTPVAATVWRIVRRAYAWIAAILTLVGVFAFWPRVSLEHGGPFDPSHAYPMDFTIGNGGLTPLCDLQPMIGVRSLQPQGWPGFRGEETTRLVFTPWHRVGCLGMGDKYPIRLDDALRLEGLERADFSIAVGYNVWHLPWRREKEFRFVTKLGRDGKLYLFDEPFH